MEQPVVIVDIALGLFSDGKDADLEAFAREHNASFMSQWLQMGLFDKNVVSWALAFSQVLTRTIERGGIVHFNLTGLDIEEALRGDRAVWVGRYTAWELQQIICNFDWFARTAFYRDGKRLEGTRLQRSALCLISKFGRSL